MVSHSICIKFCIMTATSACDQFQFESYSVQHLLWHTENRIDGFDLCVAQQGEPG